MDKLIKAEFFFPSGLPVVLEFFDTDGQLNSLIESRQNALDASLFERKCLEYSIVCLRKELSEQPCLTLIKNYEGRLVTINRNEIDECFAMVKRAKRVELSVVEESCIILRFK